MFMISPEVGLSLNGRRVSPYLTKRKSGEFEA